MPARLPPPDPSEPGLEPDGFAVPAPSAVFMNGPPGRDHERIADAILTARPGLLFVCL